MPFKLIGEPVTYQFTRANVTFVNVTKVERGAT
jgi:hypothetical protein